VVCDFTVAADVFVAADPELADALDPLVVVALDALVEAAWVLDALVEAA